MSSNPGHVDQAQALKTDPDLAQALKTDPDSSADAVADIARDDAVADIARDDGVADLAQAPKPDPELAQAPKPDPELAQVPKAEGTHFYFILGDSKQIITNKLSDAPRQDY